MVIHRIWVVLDLQWGGQDQDQEDPIQEWVQWEVQDLWAEWVDLGLLEDPWVAHLVLWVDLEKE